jgi:hypothetical protein
MAMKISILIALLSNFAIAFNQTSIIQSLKNSSLNWDSIEKELVEGSLVYDLVMQYELA